MKATVYLSRKLLNQLKVKETESKDLMLTHNLHNNIINGKRVGCSGHIQNVLNTDFWTKLASWIEANMKGTSVERRQRLYNSYISDRPIQHQLTEYGLIAPDGTWYACEFGEHAALAGRIIMRNRETFGLSDHEVLNMAYDWSGKGLDFLYKRGWIAIRNPSMGNTFLDMDETKTATKAQVNTIFDYISKFNRYDMNVSKVMAD